MGVVGEWRKRMDDANRQWDREHSGVRNPFTVPGVKAPQPTRPGGTENEKLSEMWPALVTLLGPRREKSPT